MMDSELLKPQLQYETVVTFRTVYTIYFLKILTATFTHNTPKLPNSNDDCSTVP